MNRSLKTRVLIAMILMAVPAAASAGFGQPGGERAAQKALPHATDPLWAVLRTTKISEDVRRGIFTAHNPAAVQALAGKTITISGYMMPLESQPRTTHFLLSKYTPVCFFCPPGEPNEVIEVHTVKPLKAGYDKVTVTGRFALQNDGEKGLFFVLNQATGVAAR
ncbi:MAG: hypothetical protein JWP35_720 [Caulobacter sp.]|nr:hypothetical protein [Caulobacter sp.]